MRKIFISITAFFIHLSIFGQPLIGSFSPASGPIGTAVTITGTGFSSNINNNLVYFGAVKGNVTAASATSLTVTVPVGASYQSISVETAGLIGYSRKPFSVTFPGGGVITTSSFATRADISLFPTLSEPSTIIARDLDSDGKPDMIWANTGISVRKNNSTPGNYALGSQLNLSGDLYYYLAAEDMDGDGKIDIIGSSYGLNVVGFFKNTTGGGTMSFAPVNTISMGGAYGIAVTDFDGDGMPDFVTTNNENTGRIYVMRNNSFGGTFSVVSQGNYTTGQSVARGIAFGFINNDNKPDLVVSNQYSASITIFLNTSTSGAISFSNGGSFALPANSYPEMVAIGDFDGDDKADIAVADNNISGSPVTGYFSVFKNNSAASVSLGTRLDLAQGIGWEPYIVAIDDIDGDGKADLVGGNQASANNPVFRNTSATGTISFAPEVDLVSSTSERKPVGICDFDLDGKPDVFDGGKLPGNNIYLSIFRNTIERPNITSFTPIAACAGSVITITGNNFTGTTAVSFGGMPATSFTVVSPTTITAVLGNGATGAVTVNNGYGPGSKTGFTYTGICVFPPVISSFSPLSAIPGVTDTVKGHYFSVTPANNIVYFGAVKANVSAANDSTLVVIVPAGASYKPVTVTVNNLTAYSPKPFIPEFTGIDICDTFSTTSFSEKTSFTTGSSPYCITVNDIEGNGKPDIIAANFASANISLLKNMSTSGNFAFATHVDTTTGNQPSGTAYGDFDGDGKLDVCVTNYGSNTISVFRNTSTGIAVSYTAKADFAVGSNPRNVYVQDLDSDGKPDIIVTNFSGSTFSVLRNTSSGSGVISFAASQNFTTGTGPTGIFVADLTNDGKPDVVVTNVQSNSISVFKNISTGSGNIAFNAKVDYTTGSQPASVIVTDVDADGKPDIVVANYASSTVSVFKNIGSGSISFNPKQDFVTGAGPFSIAVADLSGDKKPDVVTSNSFDNSVSVLRNNSTVNTPLFSNNVDYITGNNPKSIIVEDIDGDGKPDIITADYNDNAVSLLKNTFNEIPGRLCPGGGGIIVSNLTGTNYQWQLNSGSGFVNITDNSNYQGTGTKKLVLNNIPSSWYGYQYRCIVDGNNSNTVSLTFVIKFLGTYSASWENIANWSCNQLPDSNTDVIIDCAHTVVINSNSICRSFISRVGTNVTVNTGFTFTVLH